MSNSLTVEEADETFMVTVMGHRTPYCWGLTADNQLLMLDDGILAQVQGPGDVNRNFTIILEAHPADIRKVYSDGEPPKAPSLYSRVLMAAIRARSSEQ